MQKSLIIIHNVLIIAVVILGAVALYTIYENYQNEKLLATNNGIAAEWQELVAEKKALTSTTTNDTELKEGPSKPIANNLVQASTEVVPQATTPISYDNVPTENNSDLKTEETPYKIISDRVIATPSNVMPPEIIEALSKRYHITLTMMSSAVDLQIYDKQENYTGIIRKDDNIPFAKSDIPGSTIRKISGHQTITLQGDRFYNIDLKGFNDIYNETLDSEAFILEVEIYQGDNLIKKALFSAPPTSSKSKGNMTISSDNSISSLKLDYDGDEQIDNVVEYELQEKYSTIQVTLKSPADLKIFDKQGNYTGLQVLNEQGTKTHMKDEAQETNIPDSRIMNIGGYQTIILPGDKFYNISLSGLDKNSEEELSLEVEIFYGFSCCNTVQKVVFSAPPTSLKSKGNITISNENSISSLKLDYDDDGQIDKVVEPTDLDFWN